MRSPKASTSRQPEREYQLDVAGALYRALVAKYPDKSIMLYDDRGVMLAHTDNSRDAAGSLLSKH